MKKLYFFFLSLGLAAVFSSATAQKKDSIQDVYRRSSLALILMDEDGVPHKDVIREAFVTAPVPDKYNDHNSSVRSFRMNDYRPSAEELKGHKKAMKESGQKPKGQGFGKFLKGAASVASAVSGGSNASGKSTMVDSEKPETVSAIANKYVLEDRVAKALFDKWFICDSTGDFTMAKVQERGLYDASVMDVETAKSSVRGMGMLADAGEELIKNTFVVISRFRYLSKDELTAEIEAMSQGIAAIAGAATGTDVSALASAGSLVAGISMGEGYYVRTTSFLFQLEWNDEISNTFYSLWDKREEYDAADFFKLKYIGEESAFAGVKAGIFTKLSEQELIRIATVNATDAVLAKLEKKYDVFKTKTPLNSIDPLTAHIGMKEGVEAGDRYEVLERVVDPETNRTTYVRKGTVRVAKDKIWDNRYMASEEAEAKGEEQTLTATHFEGSGDFYPGMLLRQIK